MLIKVINALKSKVKELKYKDIKSRKKTEKEGNISSGYVTYIDLERELNHYY